ncbi:hypothetical protein NIES4102_06320 [Chondrocystis sp. NIES-4102]|nr:hypothetical protein NIES4102_06320 [Chondrocystis sp. NIES-4102]
MSYLIMLENLTSWYWTIVLMVLIYWSMLFFQDNTTPKNHAISWIILLIAPLFWPIVLPISSWELSIKALKNVLL